jgi:polyketide synthase-like dehydratase family protein
VRFTTVASGDAAPGEPDRSEPTDLLPPDAVELYDGHTQFQGPRFRAVRSLAAIGGPGAVGEIVGLRELGWPDDVWPDRARPGMAWRTDPAALDGALQMATLWALGTLGGATLPMSIEECRLLGAGPLAGGARCVVRAREAGGNRARCDAVVIDERGAARLELIGIELVRRPA